MAGPRAPASTPRIGRLKLPNRHSQVVQQWSARGAFFKVIVIAPQSGGRRRRPKCKGEKGGHIEKDEGHESVGLAIGLAALLADAVDFLEDTAVLAPPFAAIRWSVRARA
jgi:hypothetical protein